MEKTLVSDEVTTNFCWSCNSAILTPDGCLRCELSFKPASNTCDNFSPGKYRIYRAEVIKIEKRKKAVQKV